MTPLTPESQKVLEKCAIVVVENECDGCGLGTTMTAGNMHLPTIITLLHIIEEQARAGMSGFNFNNDKYDWLENKNGNVRVWLRKDTCEIGYCLPNSWLGPIWFFAEHDSAEILNQRFCNFVDDPRDPNSLPSKAFIDLGPL